MKKKDLVELHYITHIANVKSIIEKGILSHNLAHSNGIKHYNVFLLNIGPIPTPSLNYRKQQQNVLKLSSLK